MKPKYYKIRLAGHWFMFPWIVATHNLANDYGTEDQAILFSRAETSRILREHRNAGAYYRAKAKPTTHAMP